MKEMLKIKNLTKSYTSQNGSRNILTDLDLTVYENEFVCILGPSGCGKSTLLRCIAGFEPYDGVIECNGKVIKKPSTERIMVFQDYNQLFPWKTIEKNIRTPLKLKGIKDKAELKRISDEYLKKVGLDGYQKYYPHELSGGMKQRVAIAKALALKPEVILMDEPFAALDAMTRNNLQKELYRISTEEQVTIIFHYAQYSGGNHPRHPYSHDGQARQDCHRRAKHTQEARQALHRRIRRNVGQVLPGS